MNATELPAANAPSQPLSPRTAAAEYDMLTRKHRSVIVTLSKIGLALFWLALFVATHIPDTSGLLPTQQNDKVLHFTAYLLLAGALATAWQLAGGILTSRHLFFAWFAVLAYGAFDETTQIPVGRDCSIWDWTADAAGAAVGLMLFVVLRRLIAPHLRWSDET
jgi:VanZ family protein